MGVATATTSMSAFAAFFGLGACAVSERQFSAAVEADLSQIFGIGSSGNFSIWTQFYVATFGMFFAVFGVFLLFFARGEISENRKEYIEDDDFADVDEEQYNNQLTVDKSEKERLHRRTSKDYGTMPLRIYLNSPMPAVGAPPPGFMNREVAPPPQSSYAYVNGAPNMSTVFTDFNEDPPEFNSR